MVENNRNFNGNDNIRTRYEYDWARPSRIIIVSKCRLHNVSDLIRIIFSGNTFSLARGIASAVYEISYPMAVLEYNLNEL